MKIKQKINDTSHSGAYCQSDNLIDNNKVVICIFDIEEEKGLEMDVSLRILKDMDGISELNLMNHLYLCGAPIVEDSSGSFLLKVDPIKGRSTVTVLVNSIHHHYYPTLYGLKSEYILVIGGLKQLSCEVYSTKTNKWKNIPELPEERYKCCIISDENAEFIYLFGGYNSVYHKNCTTILRCSMKTFLSWETLIFKQNASLIGKHSSAIFKTDKSNVVYIIGGKNSDETLSDDIVEIDIFSRNVQLFPKKLGACATFITQNGADLNKTVFHFFDEAGNVHKIARQNFVVSLMDFKERADYYEG